MEHKVGISDYCAALSPDSIVTVGLGSCVGIAIYDNVKKIAGLAHIMLPISTAFKDATNVKKFADTCIPLLVKDMERKGAVRKNMVAKIAGGANMFKMSGETIGERNAQAVIDTLRSLNIPIKAKDIGGSAGRTIRVDASNGNVYVKKVGTGETLLN